MTTATSCDCVPGHRCDCWDFRPPITENTDGTFSLPPGHFQRMVAHGEIDDLARAIHETKGGGPFGIEGSCECREDAEAIVQALAARLREVNR